MSDPLSFGEAKIAQARKQGGPLREAIIRGQGCCLVNDPEFDQALWDEALRAQEGFARVRALVDEQAEDEALWSVYPAGQQPISEAYLQQELRRLHALVEAATWRTGNA